MPKDVIPYVYPDKLLEIWANWSNQYLSKKPNINLKGRNGFQEIAGSENSNDRSRALELYKLGLLRGPLVSAQSSGRQQAPLGWQLLTNGDHVHTPLGYLACLIGEAYSVNKNPQLALGISALSALLAIQSHIILKDSNKISYIALFEWLKIRFPCPTNVPRITWLRYLATGMFCTIKEEALGEELAASFLKDDESSSLKLTFIWDDSTLAVDYPGFCKLLKEEPSLTNIKPRKHSLFWIGSENDSRGLYSQATRHCEDFIICFGLLEAAWLRSNGRHDNGPFQKIFEKNITEETVDILALTKSLEELPELTQSVQKLMKTLREGSIEAIKQLFGEDAISEVVPPTRPSTLPTNLPYQRILFGPPGTGKSHRAEEEIGGNVLLRTTFHPDSDYTSFVGSYKPVSIGGNIKYEFIPQVFSEVYLAAWKNPDEAHFLLVEEINRGNCAQIFGDIFQSLDRNPSGYSRYPVRANADFSVWLEEELVKDAATKLLYETELKSRGLKGLGWIILPHNLYIWATMNTSDQSLFPMDSAFKRRWDLEYVPIDYKDAGEVIIDLGLSGKYNWGEFIEVVNKKIYELLQSEDKQLGNRFVNPNTNPRVIDINTFKSKVLFYLWSEIYKLETENDNSIFFYELDEGSPARERFTFAELYATDANTRILPSFMRSLVMPLSSMNLSDTQGKFNALPSDKIPADNIEEVNGAKANKDQLLNNGELGIDASNDNSVVTGTESKTDGDNSP